MKTTYQWLLGATATVCTTLVISQGYLGIAHAKDAAGFKPTAEQRITTRQVAMLLDRAHYLDQPLNQEMGEKMLQMYIDTLDPNHTLFLQSDVDEFVKKYGATYAGRLKRGDLTAGIEIFERYRTRSNEYYAYAKALLDKDLPLDTKDSIVLDREKLPHFTSAAAQKDYWRAQTIYGLIGITLAQETEKAKDQAFMDDPSLARGQDLVKAETRTPSQILKRRLERQEALLARLKNDEILETILNSAMLSYDPHSTYLAPVQASEMQVQSNLELEGIGVSIRPDRKNPDYTRIMTLVDGGPAAKTGQIRPNDLILAVSKPDGEMTDVVGFSTQEIVSLIRGKKGTPVTIKVKQPNAPDSAARNVTIVRDVIAQEEAGVQHRVITVKHGGQDKKVGVIDIPSFYLNFKARRTGETNYRSVSADTKKAIDALNAEGIDGLIVDLRGNPGGSLEEVNKMIGMFIKSGPVVQIRDNRGDVVVYEDKDDKGRELYSGELAVLVDLGSASASEIFAATMQDYGRGLIIGSTTTGKGSAQVQLDNLALGVANLTQRKFYRITGGSTQNKGVIPDVQLVNIYENAEFGERNYKNPLAWDTIKTAPFKPYGKYSKPLIDRLNKESQARQAINPEFVYLSTLNQIAKLDDDKVPQAVSIQKRRAQVLDMERQTLMAENARRQAKGDKPFTSFAAYQAYVDALFEERSLMKDNERPKLPEDEVFVLEAAQVMFDAVQ